MHCVCLLCVCVYMLVCVFVCVYKGVKTMRFDQCLELKNDHM